MDEKTWIKINIVVRVILIAILLWIGIQILYNKFGYVDPDDVQMKYDLGDNITTTISCKDALYYYADKEWKIYEKKNITHKYPIMNFSSINLSK